MTDEEALDLLAQLRELLCEAHSLANGMEQAGVKVEISHEVTSIVELGSAEVRRIHTLRAAATRRLSIVSRPDVSAAIPPSRMTTR